MRKKEKTRAQKLYEAHYMTHMKKDYSTSPGVRKLGITNVKPIADSTNSELLVIGIDPEGNKVAISREEALGLVWLPNAKEIEERKAECRFLFPAAQRSREITDETEPFTIPFCSDKGTNAPNRRGSAEY